MSDIDAKILCKSIDINNIVSIKLIVYGLLYKLLLKTLKDHAIEVIHADLHIIFMVYLLILVN